MTKHSRICAHIDMDAFDRNLDGIEALLDKDTRLCAVIKADGYGHGAVPLALRMEERERVWGFAVATMEEAVALREAGIAMPILLLGNLFFEDIDTLLTHDIRPSIWSLKTAWDISVAAARAGRTVPVHIKVDTGMSRVGFPCNEDTIEQAADVIGVIHQMSHLTLEGIFSHFSMADEADKRFCERQAQRFFALTDRLVTRGIDIPIRHLANSAAILDLPRYDLDLARAGIILYGLWPSREVRRNGIDLTPILTLTSHIIEVKDLEPGTPVSYGGTFVADDGIRIATVPVGYADGYPRSLSNRGCVLINGRRAPIVGRVCMDQFMVDVSAIKEVACGDPVTLIGRDGKEEITLEELAELSGRFPYEFACDIGKRVPRVYESNAEKGPVHPAGRLDEEGQN